MGGGGGGSHSTEYEPTRRGVDTRSYGQLSKTGIQNIGQYKQFAELSKGAGKTITDFQSERAVTDNRTGEAVMETVTDQAGWDAYSKSMGGASYDSKWKRWKTNTGVDMEAALKDWGNYQTERIEIAEYDARETRRKDAPDDLTGTSGNVDYELAITDDEKKKETAVGASTTIDESPSTASTSQSLGIY